MEPTSAGRHERLERTLRERLLPDLIAPRFPVGVVAEARAAGGRAEGTPIPPSEVEALVRHLRAPEDHVAAAYVRTLLDAGTPLDQLYLELLAPAARQLGALWESDDCSFVEVTVGLGRLQLLLRDLSQLFLAPAPAGDPVGTVLLTAVPGEQHTLGLVMVGEFLLRDGWGPHGRKTTWWLG
jgi:methanogenic corrinoid protein MtbC1